MEERPDWAAVVRSPGFATQQFQQAAAPVAADYGGCIQGACFLQLVLGHALPSLVLYSVEAHARVPEGCQAASTGSAADPDLPGLCEGLGGQSRWSQFDHELLLAEHPPGAAEVLVMLVALGISWLLLSRLVQA
eukprot:gene3020-3300_t